MRDEPTVPEMYYLWLYVFAMGLRFDKSIEQEIEEMYDIVDFFKFISNFICSINICSNRHLY